MTDAGQYPEPFIQALQAVWGEGFLSPGGAAEVAAILAGLDLRGSRVLDIGCGVGGIDCLLASEHGAAYVCGIDVEALLIDHARRLAAARGLHERVQFEQVVPESLPFADASFDAVFTKDALLHVADKPALYEQVLRVLKPGGVFAGSDWLSGASGMSADLRTWACTNHLDVTMKTVQETCDALQAAGFVDVTVTDRNAWYREELVHEERLLRERRAWLVERLGEQSTRQRELSAAARRRVVDAGDLRPAHIRARRQQP